VIVSSYSEVTVYCATYTPGKSTTGTDEETSTDGTTDGNHVKMASLHGLVEYDHRALLGTTLEGLHVQTVAGHEVLLLAPVGGVLTMTFDSRVRDGSLLIRRSPLFVVHDGRLDRSVLGVEKTDEVERDPGTGCSLMSDMDQRRGRQLTFIQSRFEMARGKSDRDPRSLMHEAHEPTAWHPSITVKGQADER